MNYETIELIPGEGVTNLYLNRPEVLNSLNEKMKYELIDALQVTENDGNCRVLILSGRGRAFSAGVDLDRLREARRSLLQPEAKSNFGSLDFPESFVRYPKPIIAAINGPCHGFGVTVSLACDIRVASDRAEFGLGFLRLGLTPEFGSSFHLPRLIGYGKSAELIMTAKTINSTEALGIGLVNEVYPHDSLMEAAKNLAGRIASFPAPAVQRAKQVLRYGMHAEIGMAMKCEMDNFMDCLRSDEHQSALDRFAGKGKISKGEDK